MIKQQTCLMLWLRILIGTEYWKVPMLQDSKRLKLIFKSFSLFKFPCDEKLHQLFQCFKIYLLIFSPFLRNNSLFCFLYFYYLIKNYIVGQGKQSVSLEGGGQLELSGAPVETLHETCAEIDSHLCEVRFQLLKEY